MGEFHGVSLHVPIEMFFLKQHARLRIAQRVKTGRVCEDDTCPHFFFKIIFSQHQ